MHLCVYEGAFPAIFMQFLGGLIYPNNRSYLGS